MNLTEKEIKLLKWIDTCNCQDGIEGFSFEVSIDCIAPVSNKVARGLLADLIKKGYLHKDADDWYYIKEQYIDELKELLAE